MALYCVVPSCNNSSETPRIHMHRFPDNFYMREAWIRSIPILRPLHEDIFRICSYHFRQEDYKRTSKGKRALKRNSIPSVFDREIPDISKIYSWSDEETDFDEDEPLLPTDSEDESLLCDTFDVNRPPCPELPDVVLLQIFSYLKFAERCQAALVCRRWHTISRSPAVWKNVSVKVKKPSQILKFMLLLPPTVSDFRISCYRKDIYYPLYLPDILCRLHKRCPRVKSVILNNVFFSRRLCNSAFTTTSMCESPSRKISRAKRYDPLAHPLLNLTFLSLRYSHSFMSHLSSQLSDFFPNLKILDLTCSTWLKSAAVPFFSKLPNLEELYLVQCPVTNAGLEALLKHLKRLKVLDLEGSRPMDDNIYEILQCHGKSLEKLYLGNARLQQLNISDAKIHFPQLQIICLINTGVDPAFISNLQLLPSLKCIMVSASNKVVHYEKGVDFVWNRTTLDHTEGMIIHICHHFTLKYFMCDEVLWRA